MRIALFISLAITTLNCFGQCGVISLQTEPGVTYKLTQNSRERIGLQDEKPNYQISVLRVDSVKSKAQSYFLLIQPKDGNYKNSQTSISLEFNGSERLLLQEKKLDWSVQNEWVMIVGGFGIEETEMFYPLSQSAYDKVSKSDLRRIKIHTKSEAFIFTPAKDLLQRMTKCLQKNQ